jgi:hypothetical protein
MHTPSRREFLSLLALAGAGLACSRRGPVRAPDSGTFDEIMAGRTATITLLGHDFYEILDGREEFFPIALLTAGTSGEPIVGAEARMWFAKQRALPAIGPFPLRALQDGFGERGLYGTTVTMDDDGLWLLIVEATMPDGSIQIGIGQTQIGRQPNLNMPRPGDAAISMKTPTVEHGRGVDPICTREPPCSMHAVSLDEALGNGKPTVMIIGTVKFCQSQFCGPEVEIIDQISSETPGANFIHAEILRNDEQDTILAYNGQPVEGYEGPYLSPIMQRWQVLQEPATYFIASDGTITERLLGAVDGVEIRRATEALVS